MVLSDEKGTYSKFYSKGHYNEDKVTEFLQIFTQFTKNPLEVTQNHMIFKGSSKLPVPAYSIKVGDIVRTIHGPSKVTSIKKISRKGLFNPITMSGSIVVDGIVSSVHCEDQGFGGADPGWIYLAGYKIIHWQHFMWAVHAPHRFFCGKFMFCNEATDEEGFIPYYQFFDKIESKARETPSIMFRAFVLLTILTTMAHFLALELLFDNIFLFLLMMTGWFVYKKSSRKIKSE
jgi:hypothetical protein